jgi:hypothetical protein
MIEEGGFSGGAIDWVQVIDDLKMDMRRTDSTDWSLYHPTVIIVSTETAARIGDYLDLNGISWRGEAVTLARYFVKDGWLTKISVTCNGVTHTAKEYRAEPRSSWLHHVMCGVLEMASSGTPAPAPAETQPADARTCSACR